MTAQININGVLAYIRGKSRVLAVYDVKKGRYLYNKTGVPGQKLRMKDKLKTFGI